LNAQFEQAAAEVTRLDAQIKFQQAMGALEDAMQRPLLPRVIFESSQAERDGGEMGKTLTQRRKEAKRVK
jgi:hypothetical protein